MTDPRWEAFRNEYGPRPGGRGAQERWERDWEVYKKKHPIKTVTLELTKDELNAVRLVVRKHHKGIEERVQLCKQPPIRQRGLERAEKALAVSTLAMQAMRKVS